MANVMFQLLHIKEVQNTMYWMDIAQTGAMLCLTMLIAVDMIVRYRK